uniref:Uncharacterized protein n=1 Tax=uncultured marine virus TaxID=186617 RepID=A0A0F7LAL5_9VIRU|nr:hypothetical protein [uncultured marine virus]
MTRCGRGSNVSPSHELTKCRRSSVRSVGFAVRAVTCSRATRPIEMPGNRLASVGNGPNEA